MRAERKGNMRERRMKSYLDLVPISARRRKRQSRMTRLCIVLAVFLVASIFSMADMEIQSQIRRTQMDDGDWHVMFAGPDEEQISLIESRPEVQTSARYAALNYGLDRGYEIGGKETVICGFDENFDEIMEQASIEEGHFPEGTAEAAVTQSMKRQLGVDVGDPIVLTTPEGEGIEFTVSGFSGDTSMLTSSDAFGIFVNTETYETYFADDTRGEDFALYVKFVPFCNIQKTVDDICGQTGISREAVSENTMLLTLIFQTSNTTMMQLYWAAGILSVLVAAAGILMISGSMNSNVSQRTRFFGMLRCLGADRKQIRRFVRREALSWCKSAVPAGLILSMAAVWGLCALLRYLSPMYFSTMPVFGISLPGVVFGALVGIVTVMIAAHSPAKNASKVSPLTAVSGNAGTTHAVKKAANTRHLHVETSMGIHHASGSKKNFVLMTCSFAFSIILFLSFSPAIDFMNHAVRPLQPSAADLTVSSGDGAGSLPKDLAASIEQIGSVQRVYGRSYMYGFTASVGGETIPVQLISYEKYQFDWARDDLMEGSLEEAENGDGVLAVYYMNEGDFQTGETFELTDGDRTETVRVSGILSESLFNIQDQSAALICSESLFEELTGERGYAVIDVQFDSDVTDQDVEEIRALAGDGASVSDNRMENAENRGAYYSFALFLYGFLAVITLISAFNIINSIAMSVSGRIREYGAMRAIGMTSRQMVRMVSAEAVTYVIWGMVTGCAAGLALNYKIYDLLISIRWGDPWEFPAAELAVILAAMALSAAAAVAGPAKRIREMSVVDTISAL